MPAVPYAHWPLTARESFRYPGEARMACYVALNVEEGAAGQPRVALSAAGAARSFDPLNRGWCDYGVRVGFWRIIEALDRYHVPVSMPISAEALERHPDIVHAATKRQWALVAHGLDQNSSWADLSLADERRQLRDVVARFKQATGQAPTGWLGPLCGETEHTVALLAKAGFSYTLDWACDDQPFPVGEAVPHFISVPFTVELDDAHALLEQKVSASAFADMAIEQFDTLYRESGKYPGNVFCVSVHGHLMGQPHRFGQLVRVLRHIMAHRDVWFANSDAIARWYLDAQYEAACAEMRQFAASNQPG